MVLNTEIVARISALVEDGQRAYAVRVMGLELLESIGDCSSLNPSKIGPVGCRRKN